MHGIVLGTTVTSLDIGLPNQDDVHFDMAATPRVAIGEPSGPRALVPGRFAGLALGPDGAAKGGIVTSDAFGFRTGRVSWSREPARLLVFGRILRRSDERGGSERVTLTLGARSATFEVPAWMPMSELHPGSRRALLSPQACIVFSRPEGDGISDRVERIIVEDGRGPVPI